MPSKPTRQPTLREQREAAGIARGPFAVLAGLTAYRVFHLEHGNIEPTDGDVAAFRKALAEAAKQPAKIEAKPTKAPAKKAPAKTAAS